MYHTTPLCRPYGAPPLLQQIVAAQDGDLVAGAAEVGDAGGKPKRKPVTGGKHPVDDQHEERSRYFGGRQFRKSPEIRPTESASLPVLSV